MRGTATGAHRLISRSANLVLEALARPFLFWLARVEAFRSLPTRLLISDPPAPADLIHVLGGYSSDRNARIDHGIDLFQRGLAPRILLTGTEWGIDWACWNRSRALERGVPPDALQVDPRPLTTRAEARSLRRLVPASSIRSVILVTEAFHAGRAARIFARALRRDGVVVRSCPTSSAGYPPPRWWQDRALRQRFLGEALRLALARAVGGA